MTKAGVTVKSTELPLTAGVPVTVWPDTAKSVADATYVALIGSEAEIVTFVGVAFSTNADEEVGAMASMTE